MFEARYYKSLFGHIFYYSSTQLNSICFRTCAIMTEEDQLLDYEEDQDETMESADKAENGGAADAKKTKVRKASLFSNIPISGPLRLDS